MVYWVNASDRTESFQNRDLMREAIHDKIKAND